MKGRVVVALMVLWVEAMGRGEWVGGIDGERGFFFLTFQPTFYGAAFKTVKERVVVALMVLWVEAMEEVSGDGLDGERERERGVDLLFLTFQLLLHLSLSSHPSFHSKQSLKII